MGSAEARVCAECGFRTPKWLGRCPECGAWGSLDRVRADAAPTVAPAETTPWPQIDPAGAERCSTGIVELDRVLGGGLMPGAVILLGGEPGIGKSTLLLQAASRFVETGASALYASAEESTAQLRSRGDRLGVRSERLRVTAESRVDSLLAAAEQLDPGLLIVDSIQTVHTQSTDAAAGSVVQVRESAARLAAFAKRRGVPVILVGHVTKDGGLAGPRVLEHLVDAVLQFDGDRHHEHRVLRAKKNRFGAIDEVGVFQMTDGGLLEVPDPSALWLAARPVGSPGSAIFASAEGSRALLIEVQALVGEPAPGPPRRYAAGFDVQRLSLLLAVLERRAGVALCSRDVFVNVTGGIEIEEPAADLAVLLALASSARGISLPIDSALFGEIGLTGEVRTVPRMEARVREATRVGFERVVGPRGGGGLTKPRVIEVDDLSAAITALLGP